MRSCDRFVRLRARYAPGLRPDAHLVVQARDDFERAGTALINVHLPAWLFISDEKIYKGYYLGNDTVWRREIPARVAAGRDHLDPVRYDAALRDAVHQRDPAQTMDGQRTADLPDRSAAAADHERTGVPAQGAFSAIRLFWIGFVIAGLIDTVNSLNYYFPSIPTVLTPGFGQSYLDIGAVHLPTKPWNALGWTPLSFYPFMIGLGMFMPLDFLFSCVFFYWFWKLEKVLLVALAYDQDPRFPYTENQSFGAYVSFCLYSIYISRNYLKQVFRRAFGIRPTSTTAASRCPTGAR